MLQKREKITKYIKYICENENIVVSLRVKSMHSRFAPPCVRDLGEKKI